MASKTKYVIGIDVGTGSVRACIVNSKNGEILNKSTKPILIWSLMEHFYEQSSEDIWSSVVHCVKDVIKEYDPKSIVGIGFTATCSLVALDVNGKPISVSPTGDNHQNIIMWMDHRASKEADIINQTSHPILRSVGGTVSLEMQIPKLLWLQSNLSTSHWNKIHYLFDLPDFLTWKATGSDIRSLCSLHCKWNYGSEGWCWDFFNSINLDVASKNIGTEAVEPGTSLPNGLNETSAKEFGLQESTAVGSALIDAYAGAAGIFRFQNDPSGLDLDRRLCIISGTSTCLISMCKKPLFLRGIWGPYPNIILPDAYFHEGGQSASGQLLDHIIKTHPAYKQIIKQESADSQVIPYLNRLLRGMCYTRQATNYALLAKDVHIWPDFHGNRSPLADVTTKGMISGLTLHKSKEELAVLYLATVQALAYGIVHIIEAMDIQERVPSFATIAVTGGMANNPVFIENLADAAELPVITASGNEAVLLGAAMLGATAAKIYPSMREAMEGMADKGVIHQQKAHTMKYHNQKYKVFLKMLQNQKEYKKMMEFSAIDNVDATDRC